MEKKEDKIAYLRLLISAYLGVELMDEYALKAYLLLDLNTYIEEYNISNKLNINIDEFKLELTEQEDIAKLQDAYLILNQLNKDMDLRIMIKRRITELKKNRR